MGALIRDSWDIEEHELCKDSGWTYKPQRIPTNLPANLRTELMGLMGNRTISTEEHEDASKTPTVSCKKEKGGGCFIATAVYGSYHAREVIILRNFRDRVLLSNSLGKILVNIYYAFSPGIAELVKKRPHLSRSCRFVLDKMLILLSNGRNR